MNDLEVLLPVHNEAETIEATIKEIYKELSQEVQMSFIICEDGSRDNTKQILRELSKDYPMNLILSDDRKGYSKAVKDGMLAAKAPYLLCLDSDGQCDPKDFWKFWYRRFEAHVLLGWRVDRSDTLIRKSFSRLFFYIYQSVFKVPVHDPSCPFVLMTKEVAQTLAPSLGAMQQGFWWEFVARAHRHPHCVIKEIPVHHRQRSGGTTQVYKFHKMPGIFFRHVIALRKIWYETRY